MDIKGRNKYFQRIYPYSNSEQKWTPSTFQLSFGSINLCSSRRVTRSIKSLGSFKTWYLEIYITTEGMHGQLRRSRDWRILLWKNPVCPLLSWVTRTRPSGRGLWTRTSSPWSRLSSESVWAKCVAATLCLWGGGRKKKISNDFQDCMINHCSKPINPTYLLGLNCADTADNVGCEVVGFWLV